jgi:ParB family chromosome partitioning protein
MQRPALGKGLEALIPELRRGEGRIEEIEVERIEPNRFQPRMAFEPHKMSELVASIKEKGIIQPIIVRRSGDGYELVAGARRLRAAQEAGLKRIPAIIKEIRENESLEVALIENIQRQDLNPIEEAEAYQKLISHFHLTHEEIATRVGKDRSSITNSLRLLQLPPQIQGWVREGRISSGHARALLGLESTLEQMDVGERIIEGELSVRQTESLIRRIKKDKKRGLRSVKKDPSIERCEEELMGLLGTKVMIEPGRKRGRIIIEYYSLEDLERIVEALRR